MYTNGNHEIIVVNLHNEWLIDSDHNCYTTNNVDDLINELKQTINKKSKILLISDKEIFTIVSIKQNIKKTINYELQKRYGLSDYQNYDIFYRRIKANKQNLALWIRSKTFNLIKEKLNNQLNMKIESLTNYYLSIPLKFHTCLVVKVSNNYIYFFYYQYKILSNFWIVEFNDNSVWKELPSGPQKKYLMEVIIKKLINDQKESNNGINDELIKRKINIINNYMLETVWYINLVIYENLKKESLVVIWEFKENIFNSLINKYNTYISCKEVLIHE